MFDLVVQRAALFGRSTARISRPQDATGHTVTVSVVIPCYNYARYLSDSVVSSLRQEGVQVQVIVVDDASTDDSLAVAAALAEADPRVLVVHHEHNLGHIRTYNDGLGRVSGEYVVLLSADDLLTPGSLARATGLLKSHPEVGLAYGRALRFSGPPPGDLRQTVRSWLIWSGQDWVTDRCRTGRGPIWNPEAVIRTSLQRRIGGYRANLPRSGDFEMWLRAAAVSDVGFVSGPVQALYRQHGGNMTEVLHRGELLDLRERLKAFEAVLEEAPGKLRDVYQLEQHARRALAREAVIHAIRFLEDGQGSAGAADGLVDFALQTWPEARSLREWRALEDVVDGSGPRWRSVRRLARRARGQLAIRARALRQRGVGV